MGIRGLEEEQRSMRETIPKPTFTQGKELLCLKAVCGFFFELFISFMLEELLFLCVSIIFLNARMYRVLLSEAAFHIFIRIFFH